MAEQNIAENFLDLTGIPESMDALLNQNPNAGGLTKGSTINAKVVAKENDAVIVDVNYKSTGRIPAVEFGARFAELQIGDEVEVQVEEVENRQGMPTLSYEKANAAKAWQRIVEKGVNYVTKGHMLRKIKGGIMVDVEGFQAFLPGSQVDVGTNHNLDDYLDKDFDVKVIKINEERHNIVVSRRELLEEALTEQRDKLMDNMAVDSIVKGTVKNITDFGAFIDLGGIDGLLHITDISWGRISHPSEVLTVGQELEVKIIGIDREKGRISLGLKQKEANPWDNVAEKYPKGSHVKGKVVNLMPYGAFIEIEKGIEGLIHVSEMSWTKRINKASDMLQKDQEVEAVVLEIDRDSRKISLGLRQMESNPWQILAEKYPKGSHITGKVRNMTNYGAFVELENGIDGMIHVSDMSWTRRINNPNEVLKPGQEVEVVVLEIAPDQQRISLGLKQAEEDPWAEIDNLYKVGDIVKGKISKIAAFGAFIELSNKIDGLIHISQISKDRVEKVKDVLKIGDEVEARVIKVDRENRRIGLSIKATSSDYGAEEMKQAEEEFTSIAALKPGENLGSVGDAFKDINL